MQEEGGAILPGVEPPAPEGLSLSALLSIFCSLSFAFQVHMSLTLPLNLIPLSCKYFSL